jgi:hypothetical protein
MDSTGSWPSMNIVEDKQTTTFFNASVCFILGNSETFLFWADPWLAGMHLPEIALEVIDAVPTHRTKQLTAAAALTSMSWTRDIRGALIIPVLVQYMFLYQRLQTIQLSPDMVD